VHHFLAHSSTCIPLGFWAAKATRRLKASTRKQLTTARAIWHHQNPDSLLKQALDILTQLMHKKKKSPYIQFYEDDRTFKEEMTKSLKEVQENNIKQVKETNKIVLDLKMEI
jgi:hypothetical protein